MDWKRSRNLKATEMNAKGFVMMMTIMLMVMVLVFTAVQSGAIAMHLELVNNTIRTKLDEIKRMEVQRLQELARIKMKSMSGTQVLHFIAAHGGK